MKNFSFVKNQKVFFTISILVVIAGIISFMTLGFNLDIDFVGGTEISYDMGQSVTKEDEASIEADVKEIIGQENFSSIRVSGNNNDVVTIRTLVIDNIDNTNDISAQIEAKLAELYPDAVLQNGSSLTEKIYTLPDDNTEDDITPEWTDDIVATLEQQLPSADGLTVTANGADLMVSFVSSSLVAQYRSEITEAITAKFENASWRSTDTVSAEISAGLRNSAILATTVAVILMLVYIAFRFQISSAFAAIVCLMHDIFIMIAAYSLFQLPVNSTIIAALLTILGYSINATIIIFDRIRENNKKLTDVKDFDVKVDTGIKQTLNRSVNTTLTTLFTIGMIYLLGVTSIKNFALPLIVGIISGLYSSVCLAGPLWNAFKKLGKKIRK